MFSGCFIGVRTMWGPLDSVQLVDNWLKYGLWMFMVDKSIVFMDVHGAYL